MTSSPQTDRGTKTNAHISYQETVAKLGQQALEADDLDRFLHDVVTAVVGALDTLDIHLRSPS